MERPDWLPMKSLLKGKYKGLIDMNNEPNFKNNFENSIVYAHSFGYETTIFACGRTSKYEKKNSTRNDKLVSFLGY